MTTEQFAYWLQGFVELNGGQMPTEGQWQCIQDHLKTVFFKITPPFYKGPDQRYCNFNTSEIINVPHSTGEKIPINFDSIPITC